LPANHNDYANAAAGALVLVQSRQPLIFSAEVLAALAAPPGWYQPQSAATGRGGSGMNISDEVLAALGRAAPARGW
jgi:hypothetical protein